MGLNLTCASTVVMCEPWWNPFAEDWRVTVCTASASRRYADRNPNPEPNHNHNHNTDLKPTPKPDPHPHPKAVRVLRLAVADTVEDRSLPLSP